MARGTSSISGMTGTAKATNQYQLNRHTYLEEPEAIPGEQSTCQEATLVAVTDRSTWDGKEDRRGRRTGQGEGEDGRPLSMQYPTFIPRRARSRWTTRRGDPRFKGRFSRHSTTKDEAWRRPGAVVGWTPTIERSKGKRSVDSKGDGLGELADRPR